ncbi:MAG: 2-dehydropantoate 2-reductase [Bacteroidetes bacterium]|nr:2-dehydropantoate 2-reductase [Bacteroidota bacterium]
MSKTKIAILGIGGVGGYFGGLLANKYKASDEVEIIFITRPKTKKTINEKGLKLITDESEKIIFPSIISGNPEVIGELDYLLCTTKSYDLEDSIFAIKSCITPNTIILPLYNGVDGKERIQKLLPEAEVWEGCVYIVSRLLEAGVVKATGDIHVLYFGTDNTKNEKLKHLERLLLNAGIDARLSDNIWQTIWEKYLFISPLASLTSFLDLPIGAILANPNHKETLINLIAECKAVAEALGISLSENIIEKTIAKVEKIPFDNQTSMHIDFQKGGKTEYLSLTEFVIKQGEKLGIETPTYRMVLEGLIGRCQE